MSEGRRVPSPAACTMHRPHHPPPSAAMATQGGPARRTLTAKDNWRNLQPGWPEDGQWHGMLGMWSTYDIDGKLVKEYPATRQFYNNGGGCITGPVNIHSAPQGPGFEQRAQDGHWARAPPYMEFTEEEHSRWDGFAHPLYPQTGPLRMRTLAPCQTRQAVVPFSLPLPERKSEGGTQLSIWLVVLVLPRPDSTGRYHVQAFYNMKTGEFMSLGVENDIFSSLDPQQPIDLSTLPQQLQAPAPPLQADPTGWLAEGASWHGKALQIHINSAPDGDNGLLELEDLGDVPWQIPEPGQGYRLITTPDEIYSIVPERLPSDAADVPLDGLRFECGGRMSNDMFTRALVTYNSSGWLQRADFEDFTQKN